MIIILNISSEKFSLNGIPYFKNFLPYVVDGKLKVLNIFDSRLQLTDWNVVSNYSVDGVIHANIVALQNALLPVLYTRNSLNFDTDLPYYNQITKETGITSLGLNKTFNAGWEWLINNVKYSNASDLTINFPLASSGKQRLDRVVATNLNTFIRIPGVESISSPSAEARPDNTVDVTFVLVTDSEVGDPTPPITGDLYVEKSESQNILLTGSGEINVLTMTDERTSIVFAGSVTKLNTIRYPWEVAKVYNGKIITLYNRQAIDVIIPHAFAGGSVDFNFPDGKDYILKPGQIITFFFDLSYYPYAHHVFIGGNLIGSTDNVPEGQNNKYFNLITEKTTVNDNDRVGISDSEDSSKTKYWKFSTIKSTLKLYYDLSYQKIFGIINVSGTAYQLLLSDSGNKIVSSSVTAVSLTIPTNNVVAFPIGARVKITQQGDGVITLITTGITIVSSSPLYTVKGQTIILEKTAINTWTIEGNNLSGEIRLAAYPNTRNDGQIPMNRVLGTDGSGNLKMFTIATAPPPYMEVLIPDSTLPSTTTNFTIKGAFFTPTMTVSIVGQTINYLTFLSDNLIRVNVTTGAAEGSYAVTLNNGLSVTYPNALLIVLGTIYSPTSSDWVNKSSQLDVSENGTAKIGVFNTWQSATWNREFNYTKNFRVQFFFKRSPLGSATNINEGLTPHLSLNKASDNSIVVIYWSLKSESITLTKVGTWSSADIYQDGGIYNFNPSNISEYVTVETVIMEFRYVSGVMYMYVNNVLKRTFTVVLTENVKLNVKLKTFDLVGIKYIETA